MTPSKSIPKKSKHDSKGKYPLVRVGTLETMLIKDILTKNSCLLSCASGLEYEYDT